METPTNTNNCNKLLYFVQEKYESDDLKDLDLVQLIILCFDLLGLKTINKFAKMYGKTYKGVKNFNKNIVNINGNKFVIDNE
jgi:hypothetical protein